jgi:hypothetical protein
VTKVSDLPVNRQTFIRLAIRHFPGIRGSDAEGRRKIGLSVLKAAVKNPDLLMTFSRTVAPAAAGPPQLDERRREKAGVIFIEENGDGPGVRLRKMKRK